MIPETVKPITVMRCIDVVAATLGGDRAGGPEPEEVVMASKCDNEASF